MDWNRVCPACMREYCQIGELPKYCTECGYEYNAENGLDMLQPRTILNGKYILGKILKQEEQEIVYLAYDLNLEVKIHIREFFPKLLAKRSEDRRTIEAKADDQQAQLNKAKTEYLNNAKKMAKETTLNGLNNSIREVFKENNTVYEVIIPEYEAEQNVEIPQSADAYTEPIPEKQKVLKKKSLFIPIIITACLLVIGVISIIVMGLSKKKPQISWDESDLKRKDVEEEVEEIAEVAIDSQYNSYSNVLGSVYGENMLLMIANFNSIYFGELQENGTVSEIYLLNSFEFESEDDAITGIATDDVYIYFSVSGMGIYRVSTEDSEGNYEQISDCKTVDMFILYEEHLYYCADGLLYRLKKDGSNNIILYKDATSFFTITDGVLYFARDTDAALYAIDLDTCKAEKLYSFAYIGYPLDNEALEAVHISAHYLYFTIDGVVYPVDLKTGKSAIKEDGMLKTDNTIGLFIEDNGEIYYVQGEDEKWIFAYDPYAGINGIRRRVASFENGIFGIAACGENYLVVVDNNLDYYTVNKKTGVVQSISYNYLLPE